MNNILFQFTQPINEAARSYSVDTSDYREIVNSLNYWMNNPPEIPVVVGGKKYFTGKIGKIVNPNNHQQVLGIYHQVTDKEIELAIEASAQAKRQWLSLNWLDRVSIFLKIAELISTKYRYDLNALTMLGQGKNLYQSEIDAICESVDYLRFNAFYVSQLYEQQPLSDNLQLNRMEYRPLEGFVFAVSPFNFTAIALNLAATPAMMGNVVLWKPASTAVLSNYLLMQIYEEAGLPPGIINFLPGQGSVIGNYVLSNKHLGGLHFTGGTDTFNHLWKTIASNIETYVSYPRVVGETGGKGFVVVHPSFDQLEVLSTALIRGAFEYQGQKCSATSRAYIPRSLWPALKEKLIEDLSKVRVGDVLDFNNFVNAVIDKVAYERIMSYIDYAKSHDVHVVYGGTGNDDIGYFIQPTVLEVKDPFFKTMQEEIFGPVLSVFVYEEDRWDEVLELVDKTSPYALTGAVFSNDRLALERASQKLMYAAGNFYINDKTTGAVVGWQPFGGSRKSGTNDKAGSALNLLRWVSPRTVKENFLPPTRFNYAYLL